MKTKILILLGLLILTVGETSGQSWRKISKEIKEKQYLIIPKSDEIIQRHYNLIKKSNALKKIKLIHPSDTIFILQLYDIVCPHVLQFMVWNKNDTLWVSSENNGKTFQIQRDRLGTKYMMKLVSEWNIDEIRKEEVVHKMISDCAFLATRIVIKGRKYKIDCCSFDYFFDTERDYEY